MQDICSKFFEINKYFCRMLGLAVIVSVARLNICQILMRFLKFLNVNLLEEFKYRHSAETLVRKEQILHHFDLSLFLGFEE